MTQASILALAPAPDFRYVGLEPIACQKIGAAATAFGLGAGVTLAMSGLDTRHALVAGAVASILSAFTLRRASATRPVSGSARMAIVPWGVLVDVDAPRILRWAAIKRVDIATMRPPFGAAPVFSRVVVETAQDRFVGETSGVAPLERLARYLEAYADEQAAPLALDLDGERAAEALEPGCEALLGSAASWIDTARAAIRLDLPSAGYRRISAHAASPRTIEVLRRVLRDRRAKDVDPRAFAAVIAAEVRATELVPELVSLTQCPHPLVAAVAKQAARRLGVGKAKTGTLDEVAPFLFERDRARLEAWGIPL